MDAPKGRRLEADLTALFAEMPPEMLGELGGKRSVLPLAARIESVKSALRTKGANACANALRALKHHKRFAQACRVPVYPMPADVLMASLEEYARNAQANAKGRARKRKAKGRSPRRNCRGGKTAARALHNGFLALEEATNLDVEASKKCVRLVAKVGPGMPAVRAMLRIEAMAAYEELSHTDAAAASFGSDSAPYVAAYSGASWIGGGSSARVMDQQRTPAVATEESVIDGEAVTVASGIARSSKAGSQFEMRALAWRVPLVRVGVKRPVDIGPLRASMVDDPEQGCMYRDFKVPPGAAHVITNAIGWLDRAADHGTIVASQQAMLTPVLGAAAAKEAGGHKQRHTVPEVARAAELPTQVREALGYWREQGAVGESESDRAALARAVEASRRPRARGGPLQRQPDRYSSVDGAPVQVDVARLTCLRLMARCMRSWAVKGVPATRREQLQCVSDFVHGKSAASPASGA